MDFKMDFDTGQWTPPQVNWKMAGKWGGRKMISYEYENSLSSMDYILKWHQIELMKRFPVISPKVYILVHICASVCVLLTVGHGMAFDNFSKR